ncbi:Gfo/Idh/MocA family protein [Evansella tamaricis]|uniref:Gfo/Idh/MocA family oxidoreductase n=1 Tax=Evansella tamaricis TaxID=2069301 RepID=A0ABS6J9T0_9BACI|nr:Gfo/Idh/MocA family oxidoreductase [Evansella tamaricis]MBU9710350.1 Gfo/Idh/MocA family oxidoreductase [Evansella tamaricis]
MINFAIIGCGRISVFHKEGILETTGAALKAVCDVDKTKAASLVEGLSSIDIYVDYKQLLEDPSIHVVNICTEHYYHSELAVAAMDAGKHVIVEKPVALSLEEADRMIEAQKKNGIKATVVFQNRYNKAVAMMRDAVEEGRLGELSHGVGSIRWYRDQSYYGQDSWRGTQKQKDGFLMNQTIHTIDLLTWMMGPVKKVTGQVSTKFFEIEMENIGAATMEFENGAIGIIEGAGTVYPDDLEGRLSIFGEKGTIVLGGTSANKIETWRFSNDFQKEQIASLELLREQEENAPTVYGFGHEKVIQDMVDAIHQNREPIISLMDGKNALEIVLAIYESAKKDGQPVYLR